MPAGQNEKKNQIKYQNTDVMVSDISILCLCKDES